MGSWASCHIGLLYCLDALALQLDGNLVKSTKELQIHSQVLEHSVIARFEGNVNGVFCSRKQLSSSWNSMELRNLSEVELNREIFILILNSEIVVSSVVDWTFTE
jgi:hypothetical protein